MRGFETYPTAHSPASEDEPTEKVVVRFHGDDLDFHRGLTPEDARDLMNDLAETIDNLYDR